MKHSFSTALLGMLLIHCCIGHSFGADELAAPGAPMPKTMLGNIAFWAMPDSYRFDLGAKPKASSTFGGFYENAPLIPVEGARGKRDHGYFSQVLKDAQNGGLDVIDLDCFDDVSLKDVYWWLEEARLSASGIKFSLMLDRMPKRGPQFLAELWKHSEIIDHPNLFKVGGKPFITSYGHREPEFWKNVLESANQAGGSYVIIGDVSSLGADVWERGIVPSAALPSLSQLNGGWYFGGNPSLFATNNSIIKSFREWATKQTPRKIFGASLCWGYISSRRVGNLRSPDGTVQGRLSWLDIINEDPDFVYLTTLNDYSESEMECSANSAFSFLDLNRYFSQRWKTGKWPQLDRPQAFATYRKALAVDEPGIFEVVLLQPEITGTEAPGDIAKLYKAECGIELTNGGNVSLRSGPPEVLPGHLAWRFEADGFPKEGFGTPKISLYKDGREIAFPKGPIASFSIVANGEVVARKWLNVPLHRVYPGATAKLKIAGSPGNLYPRTITFDGLPEQDVIGGVIEWNANPLHGILSSGELRSGYVEEFYTGPGYGPMLHEDGFGKRTIMDQVDRYTSVIRMTGDRFLYPQPAELAAPHADIATVEDFIISSNGNELIDRGLLRRNFALPEEAPKRPQTLQDPSSKIWFLRFNGTSNFFRFGQAYSPQATNAMTMPPGPATVELWIRPKKSGVRQSLFASDRPVLNLELQPDLSVNLTRTNEQLRPVVLKGKSSLSVDKWHHLVAVYSGGKIHLFIDGKENSEPVVCLGLRTEAGSALGATMNSNPGNFFQGDIARFRILQRSLSPAEIAEIYQSQSPQFSNFSK